MNSERIFEYINDFLYTHGLKKPKKIIVYEREKSCDLTAEQIREQEYDRTRDTSIIENTADAILATNTLGIQISKVSNQKGAAKPNNLTVDPIVDNQGRLKGVRVKKKT